MRRVLGGRIAFGWSSVTGPVAEIPSPDTPTRRPMKSRTGGLAITLPRITARCESTRISSKSWRRSVRVERGVSMRTSRRRGRDVRRAATRSGGEDADREQDPARGEQRNGERDAEAHPRAGELSEVHAEAHLRPPAGSRWLGDRRPRGSVPPCGGPAGGALSAARPVLARGRGSRGARSRGRGSPGRESVTARELWSSSAVRSKRPFEGGSRPPRPHDRRPLPRCATAGRSSAR